MSYENYPQEITVDEKALGFERIVLESYGHPWQSIPPLSDVSVVAKRFGPFDVAVKILHFGDICYVHKRYGKDGDRKNQDDVRPEWWPMSDPSTNAREVISRFESGFANAVYADAIIPVRFRWTNAEQGDARNSR